MNKKSAKYRSLDSKVVLNKAIVDAQPYYFSSSGNEIIPCGIDNLYLEKMEDYIKYSPTASGCVEKIKDFLTGSGFVNGDIVVNRHGETLNDLLEKVSLSMAALQGFALHVNFNMLGMPCEIFYIHIKYIRKLVDLKSVDVGVWNRESYTYLNRFVNIDLYGLSDPIEGLINHGVDGYKGQIAYYSGMNEIYPESTVDGVALSAGYEKENQVYSYANVKNSFSANKLIKVPTTGIEGTREEDSVKEQLDQCHGSHNAGHSVVMPVRVNDDGNAQNLNLVEDLNPTNIDSMFTNQNEQSERNILKKYRMPPILLGADGSGMFNTASYNDAFNYKNEDLSPDRSKIERFFTKILKDSVFPVKKAMIIPSKINDTNQDERQANI